MMQVGLIGINHLSGVLSLREKLTRIFQLEFGSNCYSIVNSVLLVTCNRVELYFSSKHLAMAHMAIMRILRRHGLDDCSYALYSYFGRDCFFHLGRVITGMDSAIFGESEIQRQVKIAYERRRKQIALPHDLHYLFQKALKVGKQLRTSFLTQSKEKELPAVIEKAAKWLDFDLATSSILFVGNSRLNRKAISFFQLKGYSHLALCTRMREIEVESVERVDRGVLDRWWSYDVVICATYHDAFVLSKRKKQEKSETRTLLFDLGVPRNIDPKLACNPSVYLYHLSQLEKLIPNKTEENSHKTVLCNRILKETVDRQMTLFAQRRQAKWRYLLESPKKHSLASL